MANTIQARKRARQAEVRRERNVSQKSKLRTFVKNVEKLVVRKSILSNQPRIDGRDLDTVRPIEVETSFLQKKLKMPLICLPKLYL